MCRVPAIQGWLILLTGCLWVMSCGLVMASLQSVPSTCGHDFFLPPLNQLNASHVLGVLEVVACRSSQEGVVSVNLTFSTVSGDVILKLTVESNQTASVSMDDLSMKHRDINELGVKLTTSHEVSVYGHITLESDVITILPLTALATSYLVPDLRTSDFEELRLAVFSVEDNTSVTMTTYSYTRFSSNTNDASDDSNNNDPSNSATTVSDNNNSSGDAEQNAPFPATTSTAFNKTTTDYNFKTAFMTQFLNIGSDVTVLLQSDKAIGVMVLVTSSLSSSGVETVTASSGSVDPSSTGGGLWDTEVVVAEVVLPAWSMGTVFYLPVLPVLGAIKFIISGQNSTTVHFRFNTKNSSDYAAHTLLANTSLLIEQPIKDVQNGHVWLSATSPVLVYVCAPSDPDALYCVNGFFLPPLQQYFHCTANKTASSCNIECPSFWHQAPCLWNKRLPSSTVTSYSVNMAADATVKDSTGRTWEARQTLTETSPNVTDICVVANDSYMHFRLDMTTASFLPAGSRTSRLYPACVPETGSVGDGKDNDCDNTVDEEILNKIDDDGDGKTDEDTYSECLKEQIAKHAQDVDLRRMVENPLDRLFQYQEVESQWPMVAVVISLCVAILAVITVFSIYITMDIMSRRRQIRNTKIRPFVS